MTVYIDKHLTNSALQRLQENALISPLSYGSMLIDKTGFILDTVCTYASDGNELVASFTPTSYERNTGWVSVDNSVALSGVIIYTLLDIPSTAFFIDANNRYYQILENNISNVDDSKGFYIQPNLNGLSVNAGAKILRDQDMKVALYTTVTTSSFPDGTSAPGSSDAITVVNGTVVSIDVTDPEASVEELVTPIMGSILRLKVYRTGGLGDFSVYVYQHSDLSSADLTDLVLSSESETVGAFDVSDERLAGGFIYKNSEDEAKLYLVIVPSAGVDNDFKK